MAYKRYFSNNLMEKSCALRFLLRTYLILNPINPLKRIAYTSCWAKVPNVILFHFPRYKHPTDITFSHRKSNSSNDLEVCFDTYHQIWSHKFLSIQMWIWFLERTYFKKSKINQRQPISANSICHDCVLHALCIRCWNVTSNTRTPIES